MVGLVQLAKTGISTLKTGLNKGFSELNSAPYQQFSAKAVTNTQMAVYALVIRKPTPPHARVATYYFPLSHRELRREQAAMSSFYDVQGGTLTSTPGVQRVVDQYGLSPVIFSIEGTTGWQYHSADGYNDTGLVSIQKLQDIFIEYTSLNQEQMEMQAANLFLLEFYDYFRQEYWEIVPIGPQEIHQNAQRPILVDYRFKWAGIREVGAPTPPAVSATDNIANLFTTAFTIAGGTALNTIGATVQQYQNISGGPF